MSDPCTRWARLVDEEALGETLARADRVFVRAHAAECPACRAEAEAWSALETMVDGAPEPPLSLPPPAPPPKIAPAPAPRPRPAHEMARRDRVGLRAALGVGLALSVAAAIVLSLRGHGDEPQPRASVPLPSSTAQSPLPTATEAREHDVSLALTNGGAVEIDGREGRPGTKLAKGSVLFARGGGACLVVEPAVRTCVEKGTMLRVSDVGPHRRFELLRGRIVAELDPQPAGTSFGVTTREGTAVAIGTAFAVEVPEGDAPVATRVLHGVVLVTSGTGSSQRVGAHQATTMRAEAPRPTPHDDETRDLSLASPFPSLHENGHAEPVVLVSEERGATATVDGRPVGPTPVALLLPPGDHTVAVRSASSGPPREARVHVDAEARATAPLRTIAPVATVRIAPEVAPEPTSAKIASAAPTPAPSAPTARAPEPSSPEGPAASDLLAQARERRARGDAAGAAATYHELARRFSGSPEAHAAEVPYGELELGALGHADAALAAFDRYLVRGGPLAEEASFGRIRALRALGRHDDARAAVSAFLATYPDSALAPSLRPKPSTTP